MSKGIAEKTVEDFGDQWTRFTDNSGFYGSKEFLHDIVSPLIDPKDIPGKRIAEIGSGTGRVVSMLLAAGAAHVTAIEPSRAFAVLSERFADVSDRVTCHNAQGESVGGLGPLDMVLSIGVLHHIPEPEPVVRSALAALKPGGAILIWLYGNEGNRLYLWLVAPLRAITTRLPDGLLDIVVRALDLPLTAYIRLCRVLPLPMQNYMVNVLGRMSRDKRRLIIFDQLNPAYAKYYTRQEAVDLLSRAGFDDVRIHHRHEYSWTVLGHKPYPKHAGRSE